MTRPRTPVTNALRANAEPMADLIYAGQDHTFAGIPTLELPRAISFRGQDYRHVSVERYQSGGPLSANGLYMFDPALSLMLQEHPDAAEGIVTYIEYAPFGLSPDHMEGPDMPRIDGLLVPQSFLIGRGKHFMEPTQLEVRLGGGDLGSLAEQRVAGGLAAETISATADVVRGLGYGAVAELFEVVY